MATTPKEMLNDWAYKVWNAGDETTPDYIADDCKVYEMSAGEREIESHAEFLRELAQLRRSLPDLHIEVLQSVGEDHGASILFKILGTVKDDHFGPNVKGRHVSILSLVLALAEDGKLSSLRIFADFSRLGGTLPAP